MKICVKVVENNLITWNLSNRIYLAEWPELTIFGRDYYKFKFFV